MFTSSGLFWLSFPLFPLAWVSAATPQEAFSCWCLAAVCRAAAEQLCWSHMAVFAWWGFIALKMPKNVSQLTFSMHVCMCVFPSSFLQNNKLSLQLPSGNWSRTETNKGCFSFWQWPLVPHLGLQEHVFCVSYAIYSHTVILRQFRLLKIFFSCFSS